MRGGWKSAVLVAAASVGFWGLANPAYADVKLPKVIGDHMVLQQDKPLLFWGWADAGEEVTVQVGESSAKTVATAKGEWKVALPAVKQAGPVAVKVAGKNVIEIKDVLVGEVWLCSGQSNMEMGVGAVANGKEEIAKANHPQIRLFATPKRVSATEQADVEAEWKVCSPETLGVGGWSGFSAAGYFFGRELNKELGVPVGLLGAYWGGTRIEPWTPPEAFAEVPSLATIDKSVRLASPVAKEHKDALAAYLKSLEEWSAAAKSASAADKPVPPMPKYPEGLDFVDNPQTPTALFNGMVRPMVGFAMRGVIWYQGESNYGEGKLYVDKTKALVGGWRKRWSDDSLAYYYVQIAPFQYGNDRPAQLAEFWEAQAEIEKVIPGTGMVVTNDITELQDIHPRNKQDVGKRLALHALAKTYGKNVVASGPVFKGMKIEGSRLRVVFDSAEGLKTRDGKAPSHFEIIDADKGGFVPAKAEISGSEVLLSAEGVSKPVAMRFAWNKLAEPNLMNGAGLPASAFRAGEVPKRDALGLNVPEAEKYQLVYDLDLSKLTPVQYDQDNRGKIQGTIERIGYFLELGTGSEAGETKFVWVSMDAFTQDLAKIGVPTVQSGAAFQQRVNKLNVVTNVTGIVTGEALSGGNIEFWPNNYDTSNAANVSGASASAYDFGDQKSEPVDGYGCMQVHNWNAKQTLFAINNWKAGAGADLGIGNQSGGNPDWTFAGNAGRYERKRLRVFVLMKS